MKTVVIIFVVLLTAGCATKPPAVGWFFKEDTRDKWCNLPDEGKITRIEKGTRWFGYYLKDCWNLKYTDYAAIVGLGDYDSTYSGGVIWVRKDLTKTWTDHDTIGVGHNVVVNNSQFAKAIKQFLEKTSEIRYQ